MEQPASTCLLLVDVLLPFEPSLHTPRSPRESSIYISQDPAIMINEVFGLSKELVPRISSMPTYSEYSCSDISNIIRRLREVSRAIEERHQHILLTINPFVVLAASPAFSTAVVILPIKPSKFSMKNPGLRILSHTSSATTNSSQYIPPL